LIDSHKHISYYFTFFLLIGGMICLNAHYLTHVSDEMDSHQSSSAPDMNVTDDCVLCTVSSLGFADIESSQYIAHHSNGKIVATYSVSNLTEKLNTVTVPRAPPFI
jgi:RsiW-degrading membrane proteinase PrsW (M82 family)